MTTIKTQGGSHMTITYTQVGDAAVALLTGAVVSNYGGLEDD